MSLDRAPRLITQRLILRPHHINDFPAYFEMWSDADVLRHTIREARSEQDAWMTLQRMLGSWPLLGFGIWALECKDTGQFLGEAGFMDARRPITPDKRGQMELAYALIPARHGEGLMTEAMTTMHAWLDIEHPGQPSFALIDDENTASIRLAENAGYVFERRADTEDRKSALYARSPLSKP